MPGVAGVVGLHTNIIQYKYTIRSIVCKASCHSVTRSLGHPVTWSHPSNHVFIFFDMAKTDKRTNRQTDKRTNRQTDEQHQGLQVCFADNKDSILAGRRTVSIFIIIL